MNFNLRSKNITWTTFRDKKYILAFKRREKKRAKFLGEERFTSELTQEIVALQYFQGI